MDPDAIAQIRYVLRRYGDLEYYAPRIERRGGSGGCSHPPRSAVENSSQSSEFSFSRDQQPRRAGPLGKFIPFISGRIILGPEKWLFAISFSYMIAVVVLVGIERELIISHCGGILVFILGVILATSSLSFFFMTGISDPGVVPKNYSLEELLAETEQYRIRHPGERFYKFCSKCRAFRPPRTFHCSRCEVCIRQQDLHLITTGNCIGERNRRSFFFTIFFQTLLGIYLLFTNIFVSVKLRDQIERSQQPTETAVLLVIGGCSGILILFMPQTGVLMLIYRIYLISVGRTAREEYRKFRYYDTNDCVIEYHPPCVNIMNFFFRRSSPSVFRKKPNRVDPEGYIRELPTQWNLNQILTGSGLCQHHDLNIIENDLIGNVVPNNENDDAIRLRALAEFARGRSTPSVPLFDQEMNQHTKRIRMPRKSRPSSILQQQITAFQEARLMPKTTYSYHKRQKLPVTLSEGCIPRTTDGCQEMIQLARASQLRRIIQMILLRDRNGLVEMSRRVNIAALVGMNRFDPDNLQLLELNNGLPMIAPRVREQDQGANNQRLGAGVLAIPQMVAAGLLPTARDLANSVETMVGRGRIRRLPPVGRQRYVPITVVDPSPGRRLNDIDIRNFIAQNPQNPYMSPNRVSRGRNINSRVQPPAQVLPPQPEMTAGVANADNEDLIANLNPTNQFEQSLRQVSREELSTRIVADDLENNNLNDTMTRGALGNEGMANELSGGTTPANSDSGVLLLSSRGGTSTRSPNASNMVRPFPSRPGKMVVIPIFSDSD